MWGRLWASRPWLTGCGRNDGRPMPPPSGNGGPGRRESGHRKGNQKKEGRTERNTGRGKVGSRSGRRRPGGRSGGQGETAWCSVQSRGRSGRHRAALAERGLPAFSEKGTGRRGSEASGRRLQGERWELAGLAAEGWCCAQGHLGSGTRSACKVMPERLPV